MISIYLPGDSWLHRTPAGLKLLVVAVASLLLFQVKSPLVFLPCLAGVIVCYAALGRPGLARLALLRGLTVFFGDPSSAALGIRHLLGRCLGHPQAGRADPCGKPRLHHHPDG